MSAVERELQQRLARLGPAEKRQVLEFARSLGELRGTPGAVVLAAARKVNIPPEDIREIAAAIEEGCEGIDPDAW